jgi:hypothetical protein
MTGKSHWFDALVYGVVCVACLIAAGLGAGWIGLLVAVVFLVLSVRAAWR